MSFTTDRYDALNILAVLTTAKALADGAPFEETIRAWATRELHALAKAKYPPQKGDGPLDQVPHRILDKVESGLAEAVRTYNAYRERQEAPEAGVEALKLWLWARDTAGLGKNPVLYTSMKALRSYKTLGVIVVPGRSLPKGVMVNLGADKFQSEVEVHGDVPITQAYYLSRRKS